MYALPSYLRQPEVNIKGTNTEIEAGEAVKRALKGVAALGVRQILVHGANLTGSIILARMLAPAQYGLFAIVNFLVLFLGTFGGTGLAANLIREHTKPSREIYRAVYSFQQLFVVGFAAVLWFVSPHIGTLYHLGAPETLLFRITAISLVATTCMVPSQIEMERHLDFTKLAAVETAQALLFNVVTVVLAWKGFGVLSFGIGLLVRSIAGSILAIMLQPVKLGWNLDWSLASPHLRFGLFYQGSQIISVLKDSITPILIGMLFGPAGVGYISWSSVTAAYPILALVVLQRLYLPLFAKLQQDLGHFGMVLEQIIWATNAFAAPLAVIELVLIHPIITVIFGPKWLVALPLFYLFWTANLFAPTTVPVQTVLNALGRARLSMAIATMWMILTWGIGWPLAVHEGIIGLAIATAVVQVSSLVVYRIVQRHLHFRIARVIIVPWGLALAVGGTLWLVIRHKPPNSLTMLVAMALPAILIYVLLLFWVQRERIIKIRQLMSGSSKGVSALSESQLFNSDVHEAL
jgi:O-antigen/teichoic acid export membrane protein